MKEGSQNMAKESMERIKAKLQELTTLIKEETVSGSKEIREEILENVNEMRASVEKRLDDVESLSKERVSKAKDEVLSKVGKTQENVEDNLRGYMGELEGKALKVRLTIQEKLSQGRVQKDEIVLKTTDSLIETINKLKNTLHSNESEK